jgi:hypothetical protein
VGKKSKNGGIQIHGNVGSLQTGDRAVSSTTMYVGPQQSEPSTELNPANQGGGQIAKSPPIAPTQLQTTTFELYFSYVEKDQKYVDELQIHLAQLVRNNVITKWHGSKLAAGSDLTESMRYFNQASVILLLISPDYIASEHHYEEVARAMERRTKEGIKVIPILVRPFNLKYTPISGLQPIPRNGKAISEYGKLDTVFYQVAEEIREVIEAMK